MGLKRLYRLSKEDIEVLIKQQKSLNSSHFTAKMAISDSREGIKVAFIASKKIFTTAILRNKAKRRAREVFRKVLPEIGLIKAIFILRKSILDAKIADLSADFAKACAIIGRK